MCECDVVPAPDLGRRLLLPKGLPIIVPLDHTDIPGLTAAPGPPLKVDVVRSPPGSARVVVAGELDIATASDLHAALAQLCGGDCREVDVDLTQVAFCDASGLNALLRGRSALGQAGGSLRVAAASPVVTRLVEILDLGEALGVRP